MTFICDVMEKGVVLHGSKVLFNSEILHLIMEIHVSPDHISLLGYTVLHKQQ